MLHKLNDAIYYLAHDEKKDRPVLGLVSGERHSLLIDAGSSAEHATYFLEEIGKLDVAPIHYLVITHGHWDHFLGSNEINAPLIANKWTNDILTQWQGYSFDEQSLQTYVDQNLINQTCKQVIEQEIPQKDTFRLRSTDIVFDQTLTIDLGNKVCVLQSIASTHTADSTIVYVPDDKVLFLGDSAYGKTTNSTFHISQDLLEPMIKDIEKFDTEYYILGHESICDKEEMELYWKELRATSSVTTSASVEEAIDHFKQKYEREPNSNERFFLQAFANDQRLKHASLD